MRQSNNHIVPRKNYVLIKAEVQMPMLGLSSDSVAKKYEFVFFVEGKGLVPKPKICVWTM